METFLSDLFDHRSFLDLSFLIEHFRVDWCLLGALGLVIGLGVARNIWYRSEKYIQQLQIEQAGLVINLHEKEIERLARELDKLKSEKSSIEKKHPVKTSALSALTSVPEKKQSLPEKPGKYVPLVPGKTIFGKGEDRSVYIMDVSRSLSDIQFENGKMQLITTLESLKESDKYQVIFFSGASWFAHQRLVEGGGQHENVQIQDDATKMNWFSGQASQLQYEEGNLNLPKGEWRDATTVNIESTILDIKAVERSYGTTWHLPFMMAMDLEPVPKNVYFLTDNDSEKQNLNLTSAGIVEMVKRRGGEAKTKVNTIAISPNPSNIGALHYIAEQTAGKFSIIDKKNAVIDEDNGIRTYLADLTG